MRLLLVVPETVNILVNEAKLPPDTAIVLTKAIDMAISGADLLTVAKFKELTAASELKLSERFAAAEVKVSERFAATEAKVSERFAAMEAKVSERFAAMEAKVSERFAAMEAKVSERFAAVDARFAALETKLVEVKAELMRWVFLTMLGNVALGMAARALLP